MVINEKALIRAMKEEFKKDGYSVAKRGNQENAVLMLQSPEWAVEITWKNIPAKVLALIVEHIQTIPDAGEAYTAKKGETATKLYSMLDDMPELENENHEEVIHRCPINCAGYEVWQTDKQECKFVHPVVSELPMDYGRVVYWIDGKIYIIGKASKVAIRPRTFGKAKPEYDYAKFLSGKCWW